MGLKNWLIGLFVRHQLTDAERKEAIAVKRLKQEVAFCEDIIDKKNQYIKELETRVSDTNMWGIVSKVADNMFGLPSLNMPTSKTVIDAKQQAISNVKKTIDTKSPEFIQEVLNDAKKLKMMVDYAKQYGADDDDIKELKRYAEQKISTANGGI